jgi:hypothetical protein
MRWRSWIGIRVVWPDTAEDVFFWYVVAEPVGESSRKEYQRRLNLPGKPSQADRKWELFRVLLPNRHSRTPKIEHAQVPEYLIFAQRRDCAAAAATANVREQPVHDMLRIVRIMFVRSRHDHWLTRFIQRNDAAFRRLGETVPSTAMKGISGSLA